MASLRAPVKDAKDCPFCGATDLLMGNDTHDDPWYQVVCVTCGALGPRGHGAEEALEKWNLRMDFGPEDPLESK